MPRETFEVNRPIIFKMELRKANAAYQKHMCQSSKQGCKVHSWRLESHICFYKKILILKIRCTQSKCRSWWGKLSVYKVKIFILSKSANKKFINSHLPWVKKSIMVTLKSDIWSEDSCISHTKLLVKRAGFTVQGKLKEDTVKARQPGKQKEVSVMAR